MLTDTDFLWKILFLCGGEGVTVIISYFMKWAISWIGRNIYAGLNGIGRVSLKWDN